MTHRPLTILALAGLLLAVAAPAEAAPAAAKQRRVLFFTKSSGYEHAVIRVTDGQPSHAQKILEELGAKNGFQVTHSKDGSLFTKDGLAPFDALIFYTTGDLTEAGRDKHPPFPAGGKELLLDTIKKGKGFVGLHTASDTFLTPGERFQDNGDQADPFIQMVGGEFIGHGPQQKGKAYTSDARFPGFAGIKDGIDWHEEWYSMKNFAKDLHVIQWVATWSLRNTGKDSYYRRGPYPLTWARMHGKGRVFHTALGHREDVWTNPAFQAIVVGGIKWAVGDAKASVTPNIKEVTPHYAEIPPNETKAEAAPAPTPSAAAAPAKAPAAPARP